MRKGYKNSKFSWILFFCLGILLISSSGVHAIPLTNTDIRWGGPTAQIHIRNTTGTWYTGTWYTEYSLYATEFGTYLDAFCVENARADSGFEYELIPVTSYPGLENAGIIASQYYNGSSPSITSAYLKAATQLAIWNVAFDNDLQIGSGNFWYDGSLAGDVQTILNNIGTSITGPIGLAHSPPNSVGPVISQDYLVPAAVPVPEPTTMLLLGVGLIGLAGVGRKKIKN